ncbi:MAG: asparagine synthase (glutamine-hydrolyzing) [Candidatus Delongbacteria bacterium]|nr:asparagine synthase (glutamine-hydrolyzing) [Candidatus Delongbacteria bacterium]
MCGISVILNRHKTQTDYSAPLQSMLDSMIHRGPDDEGTLFVGTERTFTPEELANQDLPNAAHLALGHRRLSIIDISSKGHQPMCYQDRYWIVFNGEIYNYLELRTLLEQEDYRFETRSDTEVILAAFSCWREACFQRFNGMWALAIYDSQTEELIISRDRVGIKPLVYYCDEQTILFASEIKALVASELISTAPNLRYLKRFLKEGSLEYLPETAFENIYRVPPGSYGVIDLNRERIDLPQMTVFWDPATIEIDPNLPSDRELEQRYRELLQASVELRLRSDVPVGSAFSGGLDSSSIVLMVNRLLQEEGKAERQQTFSTVYRQEGARHCDESVFIDEMAERLNLSSHKVEPRGTDVIERYLQTVYMMDCPQKNSLMSYMFTYELIRKHGVTVSIDGQGADEIQGGYIFYLVNYLANLKFGVLMRTASSYLRLGDSRKYVLYGVALNLIRRLGLKRCWLRLLRLMGRPKNPFLTLNQRLVADIKGNLVNLLHYGDRGAMTYSVESRFPFLDYRMIEFWLALPERYKLHEGWTKFLARKALAADLPESIIWRRLKLGWAMPEEIWFKGELKDWALNVLENSTFITQFKPPNYRRILHNSQTNSKELQKFIRYLNTALWHECFFSSGNPHRGRTQIRGCKYLDNA